MSIASALGVLDRLVIESETHQRLAAYAHNRNYGKVGVTAESLAHAKLKAVDT